MALVTELVDGEGLRILDFLGQRICIRQPLGTSIQHSGIMGLTFAESGGVDVHGLVFRRTLITGRRRRRLLILMLQSSFKQLNPLIQNVDAALVPSHIEPVSGRRRDALTSSSERRAACGRQPHRQRPLQCNGHRGRSYRISIS